jgi:hypothetical protein
MSIISIASAAASRCAFSTASFAKAISARRLAKPVSSSVDAKV